MASTIAKLTWVSFLLKDLVICLSSPPQLFYDNTSALYVTVDPLFHACAKHIEIDYHFVH